MEIEIFGSSNHHIMLVEWAFTVQVKSHKFFQTSSNLNKKLCRNTSNDLSVFLEGKFKNEQSLISDNGFLLIVGNLWMSAYFLQLISNFVGVHLIWIISATYIGTLATTLSRKKHQMIQNKLKMILSCQQNNLNPSWETPNQAMKILHGNLACYQR